MSKLFDVNIKALESDLTLRLKRQNLIASNLANVNTPGFQAKDMQFDDALKDIYDKEGIVLDSSGHIDLTQTDDMHIEGEEARLGISLDPEKYLVQAPGIDENGVDLDREMARMAENSTMYTASSVAAKKKLGMLKYAIQEAGK